MIEILHSTGRAPTPVRQESAKPGSWVYVVEPTDQELDQLVADYKLDLDLLIDALDIYETPRVERDGKTTYVFARYSHPEGRDIATEPLLIIYQDDYIITIQRSDTKILSRLADGVEPISTTQRTKTFLQILGAINYSYEKDMHQVSKHILSIRSKLSKSDIKNEYFIEFIDIEENLNEYLSALQPQAVMLGKLLGGKFLPLYEDDKDLVEDLSLNTTELIDQIQSRTKTISNIRDAYSTIMANNLNRIFKRLTSIGIFLAIPTLISSLYGMNVALPFDKNPLAFWIIILVIVGGVVFLIQLFKKLKWL